MRVLIHLSLVVLWVSLSIALWFGLWSVTALANSGSTAQIDPDALDNTRLFYDARQRQTTLKAAAVSNVTHVATRNKRKPPSRKMSAETKLSTQNTLTYNGAIHSERGVQLLFNGLPWQPGQLSIASARLQIDTLLVEIKTKQGVWHQLLPGERVELKP